MNLRVTKSGLTRKTRQRRTRESTVMRVVMSFGLILDVLVWFMGLSCLLPNLPIYYNFGRTYRIFHRALESKILTTSNIYLTFFNHDFDYQLPSKWRSRESAKGMIPSYGMSTRHTSKDCTCTRKNRLRRLSKS
jgi:hypothetical protein